MIEDNDRRTIHVSAPPGSIVVMKNAQTGDVAGRIDVPHVPAPVRSGLDLLVDAAARSIGIDVPHVPESPRWYAITAWAFDLFSNCVQPDAGDETAGVYEYCGRECPMHGQCSHFIKHHRLVADPQTHQCLACYVACKNAKQKMGITDAPP